MSDRTIVCKQQAEECADVRASALSSGVGGCYLLPDDCVPAELVRVENVYGSGPECTLLQIGVPWLEGHASRNSEKDGLCGKRDEESCSTTAGCLAVSADLVSDGIRYKLDYADCAEEAKTCVCGSACTLVADPDCIVYSDGCVPSGIAITSSEAPSCVR